MIGRIIDELKAIAEQVKPGAVFECDEARMLNVKVDSVARSVTVDGVEVSNDFIYVEEPTYGYYDIPVSRFQRQRTPIRIYFCKFEDMHNDALRGTSEWSTSNPKPSPKRIELRDDIEETMVRPFLYLLRHSEMGMRYRTMVESVRVLYPRARFDANEVSVGLEINYHEDWCLEAYKPQPPVQLTVVTYHNHFQGAEFEAKEFEYPIGSIVAAKGPADADIGFQPPVPQLHFSHWNTDPLGTGTRYDVADIIPTTSNINLYTQWVE